jgi:uroporphyrinogen decarboxylase
MVTRRQFLYAAAAAPLTSKTGVTSRERVDRALKGQDVDRPPFSLWHHFGLEKEAPERHAEATIAFHRQHATDLVKVMSDFPYPKPKGEWWQVKEEANPFPAQIRALELIRAGVGNEAYFVETIFNPWYVAEKLSSKQEVIRLKTEQPQKLLDTLDVIAKSEANHARRALEAGAAGIFLAIQNADKRTLSLDDYRKFSEPFDRMVLAAAPSAHLNILHIHGNEVYLDHFLTGWPAAGINYSVAGTGVPLAKVRPRYTGVLMGGIAENTYRTLKPAEIRQQYGQARREAGKRFILAPGCSVPNDSTAEELDHMKGLFA